MVRTWTFTDDCGNTTTRTQTITVEDTEAPVAPAAPANVNVQCADDVPPPVNMTAVDNCDGDITVGPDPDITENPCGFTMVRTWTFIDNCGNTTMRSQTITVEDTEAPVAPAAPGDVNVQCEDDVPPPVNLTANDNCDGDITVGPTPDITPNPCGFTMVRTWTFIDDCGNTTMRTQTITVEDNEAPIIYGVEGDMEIDCTEEEPPVANVWAEDNCDGIVDVIYDQQTTDIDCGYILVRTWDAVDACGNPALTQMQTITVVDNVPPVIDNCPDDLDLNCDDVVPPPVDIIAHDECGDVDVMYFEDTEAGVCPLIETITRSWFAFDDCGNCKMCQQEIKIYDNNPPVLVGVPGPVTIECHEPIPTDMPTATDDCGDADVVELPSTIDPTICDSEYVLTRHFLATDNCGHTATASQIVTVEDNTAPVFDNCPEDLVIDCEDDVPPVPNVTASDNCDVEFDIVFDSVTDGPIPDPEAAHHCMLMQPESPFYDTDWAVFLPAFALEGYEFYTLVEGSWKDYANGTAHIEAEVVSTANPNGGFIVDVWLQDGMNWDDWSNQAWDTGYKDDFGVAGLNYLDWFYYIITSGAATMTGTGDFTGSQLTLTHAPASLFYGYQVGVAANNVNEEDGSGGWFLYTGTFVDSSIGFEDDVMGAGDFGFDHDCCPKYTVTRTWTATDCAGNETICSYTISFDDLQAENEVPTVGCPGDFNEDGYIDTGDILMLLSDFGCEVGNCPCDLNGDERTDTQDILIFLSLFDTPCE
jgi:hypothetical protein